MTTVIYTITLEGAEKYTEALVSKHLQALADAAGRMGVHNSGQVLPTLKIDVEWVRPQRHPLDTTPCL